MTSMRSLASFFDAKTQTFVTMTLVLIGMLFVWSNNSDGAGVRLIVHTIIDSLSVNRNIYDKEVFSFTLLSSVKDFWEAHSYGLSIIIAVFSGFWPYIKIVLLMITWLQPMTVRTRSNLLFFLDQFGKFSLVDLYVCVYMIVSFYFDIEQPPPSSPLHKYVDVQVNVLVNPKLGMTTFVIGTLASVFINHFLIWLDETRRYDHQRQIISQNNRPIVTQGREDGEQAFIEGHGRDAIDRTDISEDRLTPVNALFFRVAPASKGGVLFRALMMLWMFIVTWSTVQAAISAPVRFNTGGLAGAFAKNPVRAYDLIEVIEKVPQRTQEVHTARFLDVVFTATLVVFPGMVCALCLIIWFVPMSGYMCRTLGVFVLPFNSLAAIEVFWIAGIAASLELELVSKWIIDQNKSFSGVCSDIQKLTHLDCFSVKGTLLSGCWWMLIAGFGLWSVVWYTKYSLNTAFGPREDEKGEPMYYDVDFGVD